MVSVNKSKFMRKKILIVIESLSGGGAEKVLVTLMKHIDKTLFDVTVCTIVDTGKYVDEVKSDVRYKSVIQNSDRMSIWGKLRYALKYKLVYRWLPACLVYRLFIPKEYDVEVAFCEGFVTKILAKSNNKKAIKIAWVHIDLKYNPWPQKQGIYKSIEEETASYNEFDNIITVSKTVENSFKEVYGQESKVSTIFNPIDVADIKIRGQEGIAEFDKGVLNLVTVGRLVSQKGYDILLRVVKHLKEDGFNFKLRILGEGELYGKLLAYIEENSLQDYVELVGFKKNPYPYIANSDLFVCSSRSEGYSLVIAEALVLGVPVISTYCSGPNELLENGKYGMLVNNSEDGSCLYEGLRLLMIDNEQLMRYRRRSVERGNYFSLIKIMTEIENLFG